MKLLKQAYLASVFALVVLLSQALPLGRATAATEDGCAITLKQVIQAAHPESLDLVNSLERFAKERGLPTKVLKLGPKQRQVNRLVVGLDTTNPELMKAYLERFNLKTALGDRSKGTLALEFAYEQAPDAYVTGVLRTSPSPTDPIYRWGRKDLTHENWWKQWLTINRVGYGGGRVENPVFGYAHLLGLNESEVANVVKFLENPALRAPCKSDNCVAWTSSIELGETAKGVPDEARKFLFSELGMSRSMAHFEIGRRLVHAANERHAGIVVFLNGKKGIDEFENVAKFLPPDPKIPYQNVIRNLPIDPDGDLMKAINQIPDGSKVFFPIAAGASPEAMNGLILRAQGVEKGFEVHTLVNGVSETALKKATDIPGNKIKLNALFLGGNMRKLYQEGKVSVIPGYLSDFNRLLRNPKNTQFHYDAIVVRVSPADAQGRHSLGPNNDMIMGILRDRPGIKVIAEVNPNVPFTTGDNFIKADQITAKFESRAALAGPPVVPLSEVDTAIGKHLGELIDSGATLQVGIGNIFGGLPNGLVAARKKDITIFTEMFGDPLKQVMERGVATSAETGFAYGSENLYKWLHENKRVKFVETEYVNSPGRVAEKPKFHAVNTALQVNLLGDVNATMGPGGVRISSPGGQVEFMSGAARSEGGKAIIAIRSTAKNGEISSITLDLYQGPVTTPHESVTHVVTEHGIAEIAGKTESERALALIKIADPKFRKTLAEQAVQRKIITAEQARGIQ